MKKFISYYNNIITIENLLQAWREFLSGKKKRNGTAIGGVFAIGLGVVVGLFGGFICRAFSKKYEKKIVKDNHSKEFFSKTKGWSFLAGIIILIIATSISHANNNNNLVSKNNPLDTTTVNVDKSDSTTKPEPSCPEITKSPTAFSFEWSKSTDGNDGLFLAANFMSQIEFGSDYKLDNLPNVSEYFSDNFNCEKGNNSGESVNKLYCRSTFMYKPDLKKKNIDKDGNIVNTTDKYITAFVFDITGKDIKQVNDLKSLKMESMTCSDSSF